MYYEVLFSFGIYLEGNCTTEKKYKWNLDVLVWNVYSCQNYVELYSTELYGWNSSKKEYWSVSSSILRVFGTRVGWFDEKNVKIW